MLIEPNAREQIKKVPARVLVATPTDERRLKPEYDQDLFEEAVGQAMLEAVEAGYTDLRYVGVSEVMQASDRAGAFLYRYEWEFTCHPLKQ